MKFKHTLCLIVMIMSIVNLSAQVRVSNFPDSVRIELPDHNAIVTFEMKHLVRDKHVVSQFPDSLNSLLGALKKGLPEDLKTVPPQKIDARYYRTTYFELLGKERTNGRPLNQRLEITIQEPDPEVTKMTIIKGKVSEVLPQAWEIKIFHEDYRVTVYGETFASLEAITKENFNPVVKKIEDDPGAPYIGRKSIVSRMIVKEHQVSYNVIEYKTPGDYLGIHPHAGIGLVQGTFYPEVGISTAIYLSNRFGAQRSRIELGLETKFLVASSEQNFSTTRATFLSLGYARNFQKNNARSRWSGFGVGWLAHQSKDSNGMNYFSSNTMKFYLITDIGSSKLNLVPELYTSDFRRFDFGLKLSYRF